MQLKFQNQLSLSLVIIEKTGKPKRFIKTKNIHTKGNIKTRLLNTPISLINQLSAEEEEEIAESLSNETIS